MQLPSSDSSPVRLQLTDEDVKKLIDAINKLTRPKTRFESITQLVQVLGFFVSVVIVVWLLVTH